MVDQPFAREEYERRLGRIHERMRRLGLDLLLLTAPENVYYLTGYQTQGLVATLYLAVPPERPPLFMTRQLDMGNFFAIADGVPIGDYATYDDVGDPIETLVTLLRKNGLGSGRVGIEKRSLYLTVHDYEKLELALQHAEIVDASALVEEVRLIKSPPELEYHRQAARIAVTGMRAAVAAIRPGASDAGVAARTLAGLVDAGGEWIANWPFVRVGRQTARGHAMWQNIPIERGQPVHVELAGVVARYHTPLYRTVIYGPSEEQRHIADTLREANRAGIRAMRPGNTAGEVYRAIESVVASRGLEDLLHLRLDSTKADTGTSRSGYSVGIGFPPNWAQRLGIDIARGSTAVLRPGMVFHVPTYLVRLNDFAMAQSSTVMITKRGHEELTSEMEPGPILFD